MKRRNGVIILTTAWALNMVVNLIGCSSAKQTIITTICGGLLLFIALWELNKSQKESENIDGILYDQKIADILRGINRESETGGLDISDGFDTEKEVRKVLTHEQFDRAKRLTFVYFTPQEPVNNFV